MLSCGGLILDKVILLESMDEILQCDHSYSDDAVVLALTFELNPEVFTRVVNSTFVW